MRPLPPILSRLYRVVPITIALTGIGTRLFGSASTHLIVTWAVLWHTVISTLFVLALLSTLSRVRSSGIRVLWVTCGAAGIVWTLLPLFGISIAQVSWVAWVHIICGIMLVPAIFSIRFMRKEDSDPIQHAARAWLPAWIGLGSATALGVYTYSPAEVFREVTSMHARQADNDLFPAGLRIADGWKNQSLKDIQTGCQKGGCHVGVHAGGLAEVHRPISKPLAAALSQTSADARNWCLGCHAPTTLTQPTAMRLPAAGSPSIDCLGCHAPHPATPVGGGSAIWPTPAQYSLGAATLRPDRDLYRYLLRLRPAPHQESFRIPQKQDRSLLCASCHRVSVPAHLNGFHHLTLGDIYREWLDSGSLSSSIRISKTQSPADCISCHGTASPATTSKASAADNQPVRLELFALRTVGTDGVERLFAPLSAATTVLEPQTEVTIDLLIENRNAGHRFPAPDVSFEFSAVDVTIRHRTGDIAADSRADPHRIGTAWLNRGGQFVTSSNKNHAAINAVDTRLSTGSVELVRFRWTTPNRPGETFSIAAKWNIEEPARKRTFSSAPIQVRIRPGRTSQGGNQTPVAVRGMAVSDDIGFIRYGEALIKRGEPGRARRAMQQALRLNAAGDRGARGLIAAHLAEGDLLAARTQIDAWNSQHNDDIWGKYMSGVVLLRMGQYVAAAKILERSAEDSPRDFDVRMNAALARFRLGEYAKALDHYDKALSIDPIDSRAHYNRMQCLQRLRRLSEARQEEAIFQTLREDEPLRDAIRAWNEHDPANARESIQAHEHIIMPVTQLYNSTLRR